MQSLDSVSMELIGVPGDRLITAFQGSSFNFFTGEELNMSRVTEMINFMMKYREQNPDATPDELLDYIDTYTSICEDELDFYIFNNKDYDDVFRRIAIQKDCIYNPMKDVVAVEERCYKCGGNKASFYQKQIKGLDEPMTNFYKCLNPACGNRWNG
jgi:DNA-directed RNA polymerase subunit M/transcription elongation factor TFIIS